MEAVKMNNKRYPHLHYTKKIDRGLCNCCQSPAVARVDIAVSYMRGDDEVYQLCDAHMPLAKAANLAELERLQFETKQARRLAHGAK
jgi:hypothetical protein